MPCACIIFLVDYREYKKFADDLLCDKGVFKNECADYGINSLVIGNDSVRPAGRVSNEEQLNMQKVIILRDNLKLSLFAHNMHRPRKDDNLNNRQRL